MLNFLNWSEIYAALNKEADFSQYHIDEKYIRMKAELENMQLSDLEYDYSIQSLCEFLNY